MATILLIEDRNDILENLSEYLEMEGHTVLVACNGKTGIELARKFLPDLIVCDVLMPGMNGFEVLHLLKDVLKTSRIPFIFSTSLSEKIDKSEALKLGADDYIVKPFEPEALTEMIDTCLESRRKRQKSTS